MVDRLGWTLLHFVWEGTAVAALLAMLLFATRRSATGLRYALALAALTLLAILPLATFVALTSTIPEGTSGAGPFRFSPGMTIGGDGALVDRLSLVVGLWATGVALLSLRLIGTLVHLARWRYRFTVPAPVEAQATLDALARRLRIARPVVLRLSERLQVPSAWGILRPLVVLPASLLTGLSPEGLESILLHELAHVRRHDYLINLLQSVVETVLFYHPAVWWVSSVIRREREHLCDDLVVATLGDPMPYARALLHLEERRQAPRPALSAKEGKLMNRIARILTPAPVPSSISPLAPTLAALAVVGLALGNVLEAQAQANPSTKKTKKGSARVNPRIDPKTERRNVPVQASKALAALRQAEAKLYAAERALAAARLQSEAEKRQLKAQLALAKAKLVQAQDHKGLTTTWTITPQAPRILSTPTVVAGSAYQRPVPPKTPLHKSETATVFTPPHPAPNGTAVRALSGAGGLRVQRDGAVIATPTQVPDRTPARALAGAGGFTGQGGGFTFRSGVFGGGGFGKGGTAFAPFTKANGSPLATLNGTTSIRWNGYVTALPGGLFDVNAERVTFTTLLRDLASKCGISLVIAPGDYRDVNVALRGVTSQRALQILCRTAGASWREEDKVYFIEPDKD